MFTTVTPELSAQHAQDLRLEAERQRLARAARRARGHPAREHLGRRLIDLGARLAGEGALVDRLFAPRPR